MSNLHETSAVAPILMPQEAQVAVLILCKHEECGEVTAF